MPETAKLHSETTFSPQIKMPREAVTQVLASQCPAPIPICSSSLPNLTTASSSWQIRELRALMGGYRLQGREHATCWMWGKCTTIHRGQRTHSRANWRKIARPSGLSSSSTQVEANISSMDATLAFKIRRTGPAQRLLSPSRPSYRTNFQLQTALTWLVTILAKRLVMVPMLWSKSACINHREKRSL